MAEMSRTEWILKYGLGEVDTLPPSLSRIEELLVLLIEQGGSGGGGGTTNYNSLNNKPSIAGTTLQGNKTLSQLGIQSALEFDSTPTTGSNNPVTSNGVATALSGKVNTESNKGLSTNDYTTAEKTKLAGIESGAEVNTFVKIYLNTTEMIPNPNREIYIPVMTNTTTTLVNYYRKTETYSSDEIDDLLSGIASISMEIVSSLPDTGESNVIYLIPSGANNVYSQYIYTNSTWSLIGTTEVDLSNYYTRAQVEALLTNKQDELTFDTTPTINSINPVTSGGLYTALGAKQNTLTFDSTPTEDSANPVTSGGVYNALSGLQEALTFDTAPTINSTNPVTSGGVYEALQNVTVDVATNQNAGIVKPDGTTITVDSDGVISSQNTGSVEYGASTVRKGTVTNSAQILPNGYTSVHVVFSTPMPDDDYMVNLQIGGGFWHTSTIYVETLYKSAQGFNILIGNPGSVDTITASALQIKYTAFKLFTVEGLEELENDVADLQTVNKRTRVACTSVAITGATVYATKRNEIVTVNGATQLSANLARNSWVPLLTIPTGYRPAIYEYGTAVIDTGQGGVTCPVDISAAGILRVFTYGLSIPEDVDLRNKYIFISATFATTN